MLKKEYPSDHLFENTHINKEQYEKMYDESINESDKFWGNAARQFLQWQTPFNEVVSGDFAGGNSNWFSGGELNISENCIDRHLIDKANKTAIIWEGDDPNEQKLITYQELHDEVAQLANALMSRGINAGDRVCIYMPMIPEAAYAMLACARIGAVHSVVFGGFSAEALKDRIQNANCQMVITADEGIRGGKVIPLKTNVDAALKDCPSVHSCLVVKRTGGDIAWHATRDVDYRHIVSTQKTLCAPVPMASEAPLFILYTSGSTGKPKGVLHSSAGYLLQSAMSFNYVFDHRDNDIYWCTADVGWITGHSYIVYGPLAMGATTVMFEGVPTYPSASRCWDICDKYKVTQFYTAPTAIRALMAQGDQWVNQTSRQSIRILGTVGEPINPEAWHWYYSVIGEERCPIVDTWWQTETGAHMLTPLPGVTTLKPGSATRPFFGVLPVLLDANGHEIEGEGEGALCIKQSWPSQIRTVYGDHQRLLDTYFSTYSGYYFTGDGARRDADGDYWITGRMDDVLNVSGHRLGTAEIESALVLHPSVAEAAVVGVEHAIKGQAIYAFVTLMMGEKPSNNLMDSLKKTVAKEIGAIAKPDVIQWAEGLPKTRSGKIMRRILRKIANNDINSLGDTSTLAAPEVVSDLIDNKINI